MDLFPKDPKKIKARIRSYERKLREEERLCGFASDGYGKRFLLGPLYLLLGNIEGALKHYEWYAKKYPDDGSEPYNHLCWTLLLHRIGQEDAARQKLCETMFSNLHLIPYLLGERVEEMPFWHSNFEWLSYALDIPRELLSLWSEEDLEWARQIYNDPMVKQRRARFIEIGIALEAEPRGPNGSALRKEQREIKRSFSARQQGE